MNVVNKSKILSYHLRHNSNLNHTKLGWVNITELQKEIQEENNFLLTIEEIEKVIRHDLKTRYELDLKEDKIRALYGHSIDNVSLYKNKCTKSTIPEKLYHGTSFKNRKKIQTEGIQPQSRNMVHLTTDLETAKQTAKRHTTEDILIYEINSTSLIEKVDIFNPSKETYILTEVPSDYLKIAIRFFS